MRLLMGFLITVVFLTAALPAGAQSFLTGTGDGLRLEWSPQGQVTGVRVGAERLPLLGPGGFSLADYRNQPEPVNLMPNPGFEEGGAGWGLAAGQTIDTEVFHGGKASVRLNVPGPQPGNCNVGRSVPVEPERRYRVSLWIRRHQCGVCGAYVSERDAEGKLCSPVTQMGMSIPPGDDEWRFLALVIQTGPRTRQLLVRSDIYRSTGTTWVDDFSVTELKEKEYLPVTGTVERDSESIRVTGGVPQAKLDLRARVLPDREKIRIEGEVEDRSGEDRAIAVQFRLPFDATGWAWHDDTADQRTVDQPRSYTYTYAAESGDGACSIYPVASLSGKAAGLTWGLPLSQGPRAFVLGYDGKAKALFARLFFGLTPRARKWPGRAAFSLVLYRHDPAWGMRSALQRYYTFYPESFRKRPRFEGFLNYACLEVIDPKTHRFTVKRDGFATSRQVEDASDFGEAYRFIWHAHGCYDYRQVPTEERAMPSDETVAGLLNAMVADEKGKARSYCPTAETLKKIVTDDQGHFRYIGDTQFWEPHQGYNRTDKPGWGLNFRVNEDPEVSSHLAETTRQVLEEYAKKGPHRPFEACLTADAIEGYFANTNGLDYRPEHIAVSDLPLTFGARSLRPAIVNTIYDFHNTVWWPLTERYQVAVYGNANKYEQCFLLPYVDVPMIEFDWDPAHPGRLERYCRAMAHHKIWRWWRTCGKGEEDPESVRHHFDRSLGYAIYPATYAIRRLDDYRALFRQYVPAIETLSVAGWEPVPYARTDDPKVVVERYGSFTAGNLHFTLRSEAAEERRVRITLDTAGLGALPAEAERLVARDLLTGSPVSIAGTPPALTVAVGANGAAAVAVGMPEGRARDGLRRASAGLSRIERLFEAELTPANREEIAAARKLAEEAANGKELLAGAEKVLGALDHLAPSITTQAPVDLAKALYRTKSEVSSGTAALLGVEIEMPRWVRAAQGSVAEVTADLRLRAPVRIEEARVLSPWPEAAGASKATGLQGDLKPGANGRLRLSLAVPTQPKRSLLPFLVVLAGTAGGRPFQLARVIDVEVVPALTLSLAAPRLFPGAARQVRVRLANASASPAQGRLRLGPCAGVTFTPVEGEFHVPAGGQSEVPFTLAVDARATPAVLQVPAATVSDDPRFTLQERLTARVAAPVPLLEVTRAAAPPQVDGDLSDPAWQAAAAIPELRALATGKPVSEKTRVRLTYDDRGIYLGFECAESNLPGLVARHTQRGAPLYQDDDVEVFVLPPGRPAAMQFAVNPLGTQSDSIGNDAPWQATTRRVANSWTVEMLLPYSALKVDGPPAPGTAWGFQFGRQQKGKGETSSWTTGPAFNAPDRFGEVVFR